MIGVSNSSPLVYLAAVGRFDLLQRLFDEVLIPPEVRAEVVDRGGGHPVVRAVSEAAWIRQACLESDAVTEAVAHLHRGEAQAILLAKQVRAPLLLMDERLGRRTAARLNLAVIGTAGILVLAKRRGLVEAVRPLLESLRSHHGFRLSGTLAQEILQSVDELP